MDRNLEQFYLRIKNKKENESTNVVKFRVYYRKQGMNYGTGSTYPSSFAVVSTPLIKKPTSEMFTAFSGFIDQIGEPVSRFSSKRGEKAVEDFKSKFHIYKDWYMKKYGYEISLEDVY